MKTRQEAINFINSQFEEDDRGRKKMYVKKEEDHPITAHHYGKCELLDLLKFIYEDGSHIWSKI